MNSNDQPMALIPNEDIKKELEVPVEFVSSGDEHECMVCLSQCSDSFNIHSTHTGASRTPLNVFIGKFTNTELPFCPEFAKYICKKCLEGINVLEQAEIEYLKLKNGFQSSLQKNPMFLMPQPVQVKCVKSENQKEDNSEDCLAKISRVKKENINVGECSSVDPLSHDSSFQREKISYMQTHSGSQIQGGASARQSKAEKQTQDRGKTSELQLPGETRLDCHLCLKQLKNERSLKQHLRIHGKLKKHMDKNPPLKCNVCHRQFNRKCSLARHLRIHTAEKPYECNICHNRFDDESTLTEHLRSHTGEKPLKCHICVERFNTNDDLERHLETHTDGKPFRCDICQRKFQHKYNLGLHLKKHAAENEKRECNICQTGLKCELHEVLYKCDVCLRQFAQKYSLQQHASIHTGERPYECKICQKRFRKKYLLASHSRVHTGEKPFECNFCQQRFAHKTSFQNHVRRHTGVTPYKCTCCELSFVESNELKIHLQSHADFPVQYECKFCLHRFFYKSSLTHHLKKHTGDLRISEASKEVLE